MKAVVISGAVKGNKTMPLDSCRLVVLSFISHCVDWEHHCRRQMTYRVRRSIVVTFDYCSGTWFEQPSEAINALNDFQPDIDNLTPKQQGVSY